MTPHQFAPFLTLILAGACASSGVAIRGTASDTGCQEAVRVPADTVIDYGGVPGAGPHGLSRRGPHYPDALRGSEASGRVLYSFEIDTVGFVIHNSARIESSSRREFGAAVCDWLRVAQFEPVRRNGHPLVAELRNMLGTFELTR